MSFGRSRDGSVIQYLHDWGIDEDSKPKMVWKAPAACTVISATLSAGTAVAAADTNYNAFALNVGAVEVAALVNGPAATGDAIAISPGGTAMTLSATLASRVLAKGAELELESTKVGNGLAVPDLAIELVVEYDR